MAASDEILLNQLRSDMLDLIKLKEAADLELLRNEKDYADNLAAFNAGTLNEINVTQAETNIANTKNLISNLKAQIETLQGKIDIETANLIAILREKAKTDPTALAQIQAIEAAKAKADADAAAALGKLSTKKIIIWGVIILVIIVVAIWAFRRFRKK